MFARNELCLRRRNHRLALLEIDVRGWIQVTVGGNVREEVGAGVCVEDTRRTGSKDAEEGWSGATYEMGMISSRRSEESSEQQPDRPGRITTSAQTSESAATWNGMPRQAGPGCVLAKRNETERLEAVTQAIEAWQRISDNYLRP